MAGMHMSCIQEHTWSQHSRAKIAHGVLAPGSVCAHHRNGPCICLGPGMHYDSKCPGMQNKYRCPKIHCDCIHARNQHSNFPCSFCAALSYFPCFYFPSSLLLSLLLLCWVWSSTCFASASLTLSPTFLNLPYFLASFVLSSPTFLASIFLPPTSLILPFFPCSFSARCALLLALLLLCCFFLLP